MQLEIAYETRYGYDPPAHEGLTALRLRPVERPRLAVLRSSLTAIPGRATAGYRDGWGTQVDLVECHHVHSELIFRVEALVETRGPEELEWITDRQRILYSGESARVPLEAVDALGWRVAGVGESWAAVESALAWMPQRFAYQIGATDAETPIEQVIMQGAGVCQDFAHVFLALLRSWGWPARYVSGYQFTGDANTWSIEGGAMHAWVDVYRLGFGWVGLDATAGAYVDDRYVPVAHGRDYDDVRPVRGILVGNSIQSQSASLSITRQQVQQVQQQQ